MQGIFNLITVKIGNEEIFARPFEFEKDEAGNLIKAIAYTTTCPKCGQLNTITTQYSESVIDIKCTSCGIGEFKEIKEEGIKSIKANITIDKSGSLTTTESFIDPITLGKFQVEYL
jgi:Zn ribbon nucleic-acid-binding protein